MATLPAPRCINALDSRIENVSPYSRLLTRLRAKCSTGEEREMIDSLHFLVLTAPDDAIKRAKVLGKYCRDNKLEPADFA